MAVPPGALKTLVKMENKIGSPAQLLFILFLAPVACSGTTLGNEGSGGLSNAGGMLQPTGGAVGAGGAAGGASGNGGGAPSGGAAAGGASGGGSASGGAVSIGGANGSGGTSSGGAASGGTGGNFMDNYPQGPNWEATSYRVGALCGNSICHNGLELFSLMEDEHLHQTLLTYEVEQCGGVPLVDPGNPDGSALMMLTTRKCGDFVMPEGCGQPICMPEYWVPELTAWIQNGATMDSEEE